MIQSRTHNCNQLRLENVGEKVVLSGFYENMRKVSKNLGFVILRDFYGTTQVVIETEEMMEIIDSLNNESTISVEGVVRERSSKNANLPTGDIEVVPDMPLKNEESTDEEEEIIIVEEEEEEEEKNDLKTEWVFFFYE